MTAVLEVSGLRKRFVTERSVLGRAVRTLTAVDGVDFTIAKGETLALVGESGCGKSTLGRLVTRLLDADEGTVSLGGTDLTRLRERAMRPLRRRVQLVFQDPFASLNPRMTAGETIVEPLFLHGVVPARDRAARVRDLLVSVGLPAGSADSHPHEFSGGQRQRIAIARALAAEPDLVVCDEPVSALDVSVRAQVLNLLAALQRERGFACLFISHDLSVVRHVADRVAVMYLGRLVETGRAEDVFAAPRHPYTRALIASVPRPVPAARRVQRPIEGDPPSPIDPPSGCHFHPRCPYAVDRCRSERPVMRGADGHEAACHLQETLPAFGDPLEEGLRDQRLERLFAAFRRAPASSEVAA